MSIPEEAFIAALPMGRSEISLVDKCSPSTARTDFATGSVGVAGKLVPHVPKS